MRVLFCLVPTLIVGLFGLLIHPIFSVIYGGAMFWLGWKATEARPERSEVSRYAGTGEDDGEIV